MQKVQERGREGRRRPAWAVGGNSWAERGKQDARRKRGKEGKGEREGEAK